MKCLRSGYCCIQYDVIILINPDKGANDENVIHKKSGEKCPHLIGKGPGDYSCAIHDHPEYLFTPCYQFGQVEQKVTDVCRLGEHVLNDPLLVKRLS